MTPLGVMVVISAIIPVVVLTKFVGWRYYLMAMMATVALVGALIDFLSPRHDIVLL